MKARSAVLVVVCAVAVFSMMEGTAHAQGVRKSQAASVSQTIADTVQVSIEYSRPVARGRELFGALVPYGKVWQPGANWATTISFGQDVYVEGHRLGAGRYSLWAIPGEDEWTVIFNSNTPVWHREYSSETDVLRIPIVPKTGSHMEALAYYFPLVDDHSATLYLHWGTTIVPIVIDLDPR